MEFQSKTYIIHIQTNKNSIQIDKIQCLGESMHLCISSVCYNHQTQSPVKHENSRKEKKFFL